MRYISAENDEWSESDAFRQIDQIQGIPTGNLWLDKPPELCYNKQVAGREDNSREATKTASQRDIRCIPEGTSEDVEVKKRVSRDIRENEKLLKKLFKNLLTNSRRCGIINKLSER